MQGLSSFRKLLRYNSKTQTELMAGRAIQVVCPCQRCSHWNLFLLLRASHLVQMSL